MLNKIKAYIFANNNKIKYTLDSYIDRGYINAYDYDDHALYIHHLKGTDEVPFYGNIKIFHARVLHELFKIAVLHI